MISHTVARFNLILCLMGVAFCVNGLIFGQWRRQGVHPSAATHQHKKKSSLLMQIEYDASSSYADDSLNIHPKDTLVNIGETAFAPDIAYFYLQNTLGLSEEAMWRVTLESESILGMTPRNLEKKVSSFVAL